jgi:spore maturation protein CgeB
VKIVIFGLTISSSWGNGHATLWRGLCKNLVQAGHNIVFYERDVPYYAGTRDLFELPGGRIEFFTFWDDVLPKARADLQDADAAIVTSYCPDGLDATELMLGQDRTIRVFYDLDTPVTLARLEAGETLSYIGPNGLRDFDLILSFTGGPRIFDAFRQRLGARQVRALYGHVDPDVHRPVPPQPHYRADLSYLGTYSEDRQAGLQRLFVEPAAIRQDLRFLIGGAQYPQEFPWSPNIYFVRHLPPSEHPAFFASSRLTLNVTRSDMATMGWCPSGRLFEAAACGAPIVSDAWAGLDEFFVPGEEIVLAENAEGALAAIEIGDERLQRIARRARERTLEQHSSEKRARELIALLERSKQQSESAYAIEEA